MNEIDLQGEAMAKRAIAFINSLKHTKGTWHGKNFDLLPWQEKIIREIFGTLKTSGYRQYNTAYVEIPKKQGKSELAAAIALYLTCGDGEHGAEVYGCASDRQQASIVFDVVVGMIEQCPALKKRCKIMASQKRIIYLPLNSFYQIPAFSFDGIVGVSPITYARESMGLALATEEFGARFFGNGARPGGVLEHPGVVKDPERLRDSWNKVYQGTKNSHKVAVLEEGLKYHEIGMSPEDSQFLETRAFQLNEICRIFRVPPHMIGDLSRSTFSNIEHQSIDFVVHTIRPWLVRWEQAIKRSCLTEEERTIYFAKFNVDGLLRGDFNSRMAGYATARQNGWMSANEIRALEDMNKIPADQGGDAYLINGNMTKITE